MKKALTLLGAAVACLSLAAAPTVRAQDVTFTTQMVLDRAEIDDLLERYYANFGKAEGEAFSSFYAPDAQFVLGAKSYKGQEEIAGVYKGIGTSGQSPAANRFSFNVLLTNKVITTHGDKATAQMIFTEVIMDTAAGPPKFLTPGPRVRQPGQDQGPLALHQAPDRGRHQAAEGWVN
ncbi:MAG: nuclear transport factor 2 family protein [Caulobacteraceae bacterium]